MHTTMASSSLLLVVVATVLVLSNSAFAKSNLTYILESGERFKEFIRHLNDTRAFEQIENQLNNSQDGLTIFAPTDDAFKNLAAGTLNNLDRQKLVALIQFHIVSKFYDFKTIHTASNPLPTQGGGITDGYGLNVNGGLGDQRFNVSTGVNMVTVTEALNTTFPHAVFVVEEVLWPLAFTKSPSPNPPPSSMPPLAPEGRRVAFRPSVPDPSQKENAASVAAVVWRKVVGAALVTTVMALL